MATAIPDRFLHHAEVITITGQSYRLHQKAWPAGGRTRNNPKKSADAACSEPVT